MDKNYNPHRTESQIYETWERAGHFKSRPAQRAYTIVIPPPNITGRLHIGHALNNTLQDILIRRQRMGGAQVLWQPGTDHASIATQMVVERRLKEEGKPSRRDMGRAAFLKEVWAWKDTAAHDIERQLKRLGCSCDWSRTRFTMDDGLSHAVRSTFVELYKAGLIYKDQRLVNWDPAMETAISNLEVIPQEVQGHLWHIRYPLETPDALAFITVATTRPETMLGDVAVAVHPDDPRWQDHIGQNCILPLTGRKIPIIADTHADPGQGSGAVKITPAHDFDDFNVGQRHQLPMLSILDSRGRICAPAPETYHGMDRFEARTRIVQELQGQGLLEKIDDIVHTVPFGERGGVPVEPMLTEQWYMDAEALAQPALEVVQAGKVRFVPENWTNTYRDWMENIQPWCISRQLWWGHRIPAWYGPDGTIFVAMTAEDAQRQAQEHYGHPCTLEQDEDVLDTWFSSALWPFSTLGWPHETPEILKAHYPTDVLVTGHDIIFFWVARMVMMGLHFLDQEPFHTVYIHALVRDAEGQKMSKSKGNVIDPLVLIDTYGADALRITLAGMAAPGRDLKLSEDKVAGGRNFITKLWNACRFAGTVLEDTRPSPDLIPPKHPINRWIVSRFVQSVQTFDTALEAMRFHESTAALMHFVRDELCDWYIEAIKVLLRHDDPAQAQEIRETLGWVIHGTLRALHPTIPFVTESLWRATGSGESDLIIASWPEPSSELVDVAACTEVGWVNGLIGQIRSARAQFRIPPGQRLVFIAEVDASMRERIAGHRDVILHLARLEGIVFEAVPRQGMIRIVQEGGLFALNVGGVLDLSIERARLTEQRRALVDDLERLEGRVANPQFLERAPEDVVAESRERIVQHQREIAQLEEALGQL